MNDPLTPSKPAEPEQPCTASKLLPLVYEKLRQVARARMLRESTNHSLQGTALVHEAYLRLSGTTEPIQWNGTTHFFAAISEIMRRILIEKARARKRLKRGGRDGSSAHRSRGDSGPRSQ